MSKRISDTINIGSADIFITPHNTGKEIYLGLTKDGAVFKYESEYHDIQADQYGNMVLDKILIGEKCNCEVKVLDTSKDSIYDTMSTAKKLSDGSIGFGQRPGLRASRHTCKLRIHPVSMGANNKDYDVIIYNAFNEAGLELAYKKDDEWVIPCNFIGIADLSRADGDLLFKIGEDTPSSDNEEKTIRELSLTPHPNNLIVGDKVPFKANAIFTDGTNGDVTEYLTWASANPEIIKIDENTGVAEILKPGVTTITAYYFTQTFSISMTAIEGSAS